jgi:hypothetical protein
MAWYSAASFRLKTLIFSGIGSDTNFCLERSRGRAAMVPLDVLAASTQLIVVKNIAIMTAVEIFGSLE